MVHTRQSRDCLLYTNGRQRIEPGSSPWRKWELISEKGLKQGDSRSQLRSPMIFKHLSKISASGNGTQDQPYSSANVKSSRRRGEPWGPGQQSDKMPGQDPRPGAREKKVLLRELRSKKATAFSVVGDISKAHRRYKHQSSEHGYMGCQVNEEEELKGVRSDGPPPLRGRP